jgi:hypothetical protein
MTLIDSTSAAHASRVPASRAPMVRAVVGIPNSVASESPKGGDQVKGTKIMTETTNNTTATIAQWAAQGRTFTDARNAGVAHLIATGVKQATIVSETGLDKGDVSRVAKLVKELPAPQVKSLKGLKFPSADSVLDPTAIRPWAKFGESYLRRNKAAGAPRTEKSAEQKLRDSLATAFDLIVKNPEQEAGWLALIADMFTPELIAEHRAGAIDDESAEQAA